MEAFTSRLTIRARREIRTAGAAGVADVATYWLVLAGLYVLQGGLWYYSFKEKLFDDNATAPGRIHKQFAGTIIDSVPGVDAAWVILGVLEGLVCVALAISLVRGEFLPTRRKPWLFVGLGTGALTLAVMLFAQSLTKQFDSVANLYAYFAGTAVLIVLVLLMPPYRPAHWLSSLVQRRDDAAD